jgi:hypothetical protein
MSIRSLCAIVATRLACDISFQHRGQHVSMADAAWDASTVPMALAAGMLIDRNAQAARKYWRSLATPSHAGGRRSPVAQAIAEHIRRNRKVRLGRSERHGDYDSCVHARSRRQDA